MAQRMTGAQAVVESLVREGVKHLFTVPGTTVLNILDALYHQNDIRLVVARHEQGAAFMAEGYARMSGGPGVCMVSRGPGAANTTSCLHNAYAASSPVVALVGEVATGFQYRDAFEEMDLMTFFGPVTKWSARVGRADRIPELVQRSIRTSVAGRPRPVMLAIPHDIQKHETEAEFLPGMPATGRPVPCDTDLQRACDLLGQAQKPLVLAGGGVTWAGGTSLLTRLADITGIPVVSTYCHKDNFPNQHPCFLGTLTQSSGCAPATVKAAEDADVVLALGCRFSEFTTRSYKLFRNTGIIQVDIDPLEMGKVYTPKAAILADLGKVLEGLIEKFEQQPDSIRGRDWHKALADRYLRESIPPVPAGDEPVHPAQVTLALQEVLPDDAMIVADSGSFRSWFDRYYRFSPGTLMAPGGGCMGFGLPASLGAKIAGPDREVVCVAGDGGAMMTIAELETAVRYGLKIMLVVMNNNCYGNVKNHQRNLFGGRFIGVDLGNPDFAALAVSFGALGISVEKNSGLIPAFRKAMNHPGPSLVEVLVDPGLIQP